MLWSISSSTSSVEVSASSRAECFLSRKLSAAFTPPHSFKFLNGISGIQSVVVSSSWMVDLLVRFVIWLLMLLLLLLLLLWLLCCVTEPPENVAVVPVVLVLADVMLGVFESFRKRDSLARIAAVSRSNCTVLCRSISRLRGRNGSVRLMRNVLMFIIFRWLSRLPPFPGSTSYVSFRHLSVASEMCTRPGTPPDSMWFAMTTSFDHTSKCHFFSPSTPHMTEPL
uniref:Uncharacterized protein n=1 Tax=Anopheles christyi TaxID=43041 RepID=A0A182KJ58_9DIPT